MPFNILRHVQILQPPTTQNNNEVVKHNMMSDISDISACMVAARSSEYMINKWSEYVDEVPHKTVGDTFINYTDREIDDAVYVMNDEQFKRYVRTRNIVGAESDVNGTHVGKIRDYMSKNPSCAPRPRTTTDHRYQSSPSYRVGMIFFTERYNLDDELWRYYEDFKIVKSLIECCV